LRQQEAAAAIGVKLLLVDVPGPGDLDQSFARAAVAGVDALIVNCDPVLLNYR